MGAFGAGTFTAENNFGYGGFGGTSGATPHVAGTIALLYSANCQSFIDFAKQSPAQAALQIKNYIYDGLDPNSSIANITSQGGRLNVGASLNLLLDFCNNCPSVYNTNAIVNEISSTITWEDSLNTNYRVIYKIDNNTEWDTAFSTSSPHIIPNLNKCSAYDIIVQNLCSDSTWSSSTVNNIETESCCYLTGLTEVTTTQNASSLTWNTTLGTNGYTIYYKPSGNIAWMDSVLVDSLTTSYTISGLSSCTTYEVEVKSNCTDISQFESILVSTNECETCTSLTYCTNNNFSSNQGYIQKVSSNTFTNESTFGNSGFESFEPYSHLTLERVGNNVIKVETSTSFSSFETVMWIDYNHNGEFDDDEMSDSYQNDNTFTFINSVPDSALNGITRMRIIYQYNPTNGNIDACGAQFGSEFGEVEDYCVNILEPLKIEEYENKSVSIFPNPVNNELNLINHSEIEYKLEIINSLGKIVKSESISNLEQKSIDVSTLPKGIFTINMTNKYNQIQTKKFIKI